MNRWANESVGQSKSPSVRQKYAWYLKPPFDEEFERTRWWNSETDNPIGALYELARRHPLIGELRSKYRSQICHGQELRPREHGSREEEIISQASDDLGQNPRAVHCLCLIGLKAWSNLG